jgi:hypothetical protein
MAKDKPTLADFVESAERRAAPRVQARTAKRGNGAAPWVLLGILTVVLLAGAAAWLRAKGLLPI